MKFIKDNLILIIVAGLCLWNIFSTSGIKADLNSYKDEVKAAQKKIDSANAENAKLDLKIDSARNNIIHIDREINHINNNITTIKKNTYEKVNAVDLLGNVELQGLFSARYYKGSVIDSTSKTGL